MAVGTSQRVRLHGDDLEFRDVGAGPAVLFIHGLLGSSDHWRHLVDEVSGHRRLIVPDLFGHGASAKPAGDYSLGSHAATLRDLLDVLHIDRVTVVGHSLGGGIAMQFAYLFPERVDALVLVSSGGLGRELSPLLRAATLPGSEWVLPVLASSWLHERVAAAGRTVDRVPLASRGLARLATAIGARVDVAEGWRGLASLRDAASRKAFLATSRSVIDPHGQIVQAGPRLASIGGTPTLFVWGARDRIIPAWHGVLAQQQVPGSELTVFETAGHFPHLDDPARFAALLQQFFQRVTQAQAVG
jgi:pimeloyl-ACP methyl ester carboxylesterase